MPSRIFASFDELRERNAVRFVLDCIHRFGEASLGCLLAADTHRSALLLIRSIDLGEVVHAKSNKE